MFLGAHVRRLTGRENIHVWMGECHVHAGIDPENIRLQREPASRGRVPDSSRVRLLDERARGDVGGRRRSGGRADSLDRRDDQATGAVGRRRVHRRDRGRDPAPSAARESEQAILRGERARVVRLHEGHDAAEGARRARAQPASHHGAAGGRRRGRVARSSGWWRSAAVPSSPCLRCRTGSIQGSRSAVAWRSPELPRERPSTPRTITPMSVPAVTGIGMLRFPLKQDALDELVRGRARGGRRVQRHHDDRDGRLGSPIARDARGARQGRDLRRAARARGVSSARRQGLDSHRPRGRVARAARATRALRDRPRSRPALGGARRAQLSAAAVGDRVADREVRRCGEGDERQDSRHAQDDAGLARAREVRGAQPAAERTTAWICRRAC